MLDKSKMEYISKMKREVMSDDEIARADRYLELFRSAYNSKANQGEIERIGILESYYQGLSNISDDPNAPNSNINIVQPLIEGQVSLMASEDIGVEAIPVEPGDMEFKEDVEDMLDFVFEKNNKALLLERASRKLSKFGMAIFRVMYDGSWKNGYGLPKIELVNNAYFFPDPNINDVTKLQESEFVIETCVKPIFWARQKFGDEKAGAIFAGFDPVLNDIFEDDNASVDDISSEKYIHIYLWIKEKDGDEFKLKLVQMSGCGVILDETDNKEKDEDVDDEYAEYGETENFPDNMFPYFIAGLYEKEGSFYWNGDIDVMIDGQNLINDIDDQIRLNARLSGNPQVLVGEGSGIDVRKWTNKPSLRIVAKDINDVRHFQPAEMAQTPINRRNYFIDRERNLLSRFSDQMIGLAQKGVESATESLQLADNGGNTTSFKKYKLQNVLSEVATYCLKLIMTNWNEEKVIPLLRDGRVDFNFFNAKDMKNVPVMQPIQMTEANQFLNNGFEPPSLSVVKDESGNMVTKSADFDVIIKIGAGSPRNKAFILNALNEMLARGAMMADEYRRYAVTLLKLPISTEMPQMLQQQMQQQMAMGQMNNSTAQAASGASAQMGDAVGVPGELNQAAY